MTYYIVKFCQAELIENPLLLSSWSLLYVDQDLSGFCLCNNGRILFDSWKSNIDIIKYEQRRGNDILKLVC